MERNRTKGFTIIELMLVVAVMGILASIALPAYNNLIESNRRAAAVNDFLSTIYLARSEAITRNNYVSVCRANAAQTACVGANGVWQTGWLIFQDDDFDGVVDAGDEIIAVGGPVRGPMVIRSAQFGAHMTFSPQGRVIASNGDRAGDLLLCEQGVTEAVRVIVIDRTGRPRVGTETLAGVAGNCTT